MSRKLYPFIKMAEKHAVVPLRLNPLLLCFIILGYFLSKFWQVFCNISGCFTKAMSTNAGRSF